MKKYLIILNFIFFSIINAESIFHDSEYFYLNKNIIKNYTQQAEYLNINNITCGTAHCYGLKNETIWSVGFNNHGQLGLGDNNDRYTFTEVPFTLD